MKLRMLTGIVCALFTITGCYLPINGKVIDAVTQQPIEGAVVLVEWTKTHGIGDHWTESYKVVEVVSDKEGKVTIAGCYSPFVDPPDVTVYKKGYVAWNSAAIFQGSPRADFKWGDYLFKLEHFKPEYSYEAHTIFISIAIHSSIGIDRKKIIEDAFYWEELEASKELNEQSK